MNENKLELFHNLIHSKQYFQMKRLFSKVFGEKVVWAELTRIPKSSQELLACCSSTKNNRAEIKRNFDKIVTALRKSVRLRSKQTLKYSSVYLIYIFPLKKQNTVFGNIVIFNVRKNISQNYINIFTNYLQALILKTQDDLELARLYKTIQPRAAALSTIHTIHRLVNTTSLNLRGLLPYIARLSLQVMKVKKCSIYLMNKNKKYLTHEITVTDKGQIKKKEIIKLGEGLVGRVAKTAVPILIENSLAMPLTEEDVLGVIVVSEKINNQPIGYYDQEILTTLSEQAVIAIKNMQLDKQREKLTIGSIKSLSTLSGSREIQAHIPKIKYRNLVTAIAKELNLSKQQITTLNYSALLHDVGKVGVPEEILRKTGSLTSKEYQLIKQHPSRGAAVLKHLKALEPAIPIILHHHEKYDGSGYPDGLKGKQIPQGARILAIIDALEAMITKRPYRRAKTFNQAVKEIKRNSGTQFDPEAVKAFLKVIQKRKIDKSKIIK